MPTESLLPELLHQRLAGSMKLVETTCELAGQSELDQVLETVAVSVCKALGCERASLFLYDKHSDELYTRVTTELEIEEIRISLDTGISGWVARRRQIANIPDPAADDRWNSTFDRKTGFQTRNILAAPLFSSHNDRLVGVLQLLNKSDGEFDDFDETLIQAFGTHAANALERAQLLEEARKRKELEVEIDMGRQIQTSFLPEKLPEVAGYEIAAWWQPAEAVSGDYYDALLLEDGRLCLVVADVCGHGVGPSLLMASVRAMLRVLARIASDPEKIMAILGETISPDLNDGRFITTLIAALDSKTQCLSYANAGHGPALHFKRETGEFRIFASTMPPLGFAEDFSRQRVLSFAMEPGDIVVLGTDGAIELKNEAGEIFGRKRLEQLISDNRNASMQQLVDIIRDAINEFHPHEIPPDDCTLMLLSRKQ